jgi:hypothetical protein
MRLHKPSDRVDELAPLRLGKPLQATGITFVRSVTAWHEAERYRSIGVWMEPRVTDGPFRCIGIATDGNCLILNALEMQSRSDIG